MGEALDVGIVVRLRGVAAARVEVELGHGAVLPERSAGAILVENSAKPLMLKVRVYVVFVEAHEREVQRRKEGSEESAR